MPFIVGVGEPPEEPISIGSISLSSFLGKDLKKISCQESPNYKISLLNKNEGLFQLIGDAAFVNDEGDSWLEALGAWKIPTILMVLSNSDGTVPGIASAYVAFCKYLSVPLIGTIQLGGDWDQKRRSLDGLPWCGRISIQNPLTNRIDSCDNPFEVMQIEDVVAKIRRQMIALDL